MFCYSKDIEPEESVPTAMEVTEVSHTTGATDDKVESKLSTVEQETTEVIVVEQEKKSRPPTTEPAPLLELADQLLTIFHNIEPYLEVLLTHAVKIFQLGWRHTGWAFSKIAPAAEKSLIMELEDDSSGLENVAHVAQETWKKRGDMYQRQLKKVAKATQGLVNGLNKEVAKKVLKQART